MHLLSLCEWLENTPPAAALRSSIWMFYLAETIHTLGIILVAGTIMLVDLRLLGFWLKRANWYRACWIAISPSCLPLMVRRWGQGWQ